MTEDKIKKFFNKKEIEQIVQDNLLNFGFNKYPNDKNIFDKDIRNSLIDNIILTYLQYCKISKDKLANFSQYMRYELDKMLLSRIMVDPPIYSLLNIQKIDKQIELLKLMPQPVQRSEDWYKFRKDRLTASDLGVVLGISPYNTYDKLVLKKCGHEEPFKAGSAIIHGQKYEDVAIAIYEHRNKVNVFEFGCLPHKNINHFGASPDGICDKDSENKDYIGRMLEIKCPSSRPITGFTPNYYYAQVQGQLEVCDLEYCDFLECKITEYKSSYEYYTDLGESDLYRENGLEKGVLIELWDNRKKKSKYIYYGVGGNKEDIHKWENEIINKSLDNIDIDYTATVYWKLELCNCLLIKRDNDWFNNAKPKIDNFWKDVLKYRETGIEYLLEKTKPKKRIKLDKTVKSKSLLNFLSESD